MVWPRFTLFLPSLRLSWRTIFPAFWAPHLCKRFVGVGATLKETLVVELDSSCKHIFYCTLTLFCRIKPIRLLTHNTIIVIRWVISEPKICSLLVCFAFLPQLRACCQCPCGIPHFFFQIPSSLAIVSPFCRFCWYIGRNWSIERKRSIVSG